MSSQGSEKGEKRQPLLLKGAKGHMAESVSHRTDEKPITGWRARLPLVGAAVGLIVLASLTAWLGTWEAVAFGLFFLYAITFAFTVLPTYLLVKGLMSHSRREAMLRRGAIEYLRATSEGSGAGPGIASELANLESIEKDAANSERFPQPLYTAFGALPLVGVAVTLVYLRSLERVAPGHERRWAAFVQQVSSAGAKLSLAPGLRASNASRKSYFMPFAVVTVVFPPFVVWWYHVLIRHAAAHIRSQHNEEDALLQLLV